MFVGPYDTKKILVGVLEALPTKRPLLMQKSFPETAPTNNTTVNFDKAYKIKNVMGMFVAPTVDADPVKLPIFGHQEYPFAYSKEDIDSDSFEELNSRQIGQQFGEVDIQRNKLERFVRKVALVEQRFENLFELVASSMALYGGYIAASEKHPTIIYDFSRHKATLASEIFGDDALQAISSVNLTASAVTAPWGVTALPVIATDGGLGYTQGQKAWAKATIDAGTATPVEDVNKIAQTVYQQSTLKHIIMSDNAYKWFEYDVNKNYADAANQLINVQTTLERVVLPQLEDIDGLTFRRMYTFSNNLVVPIYSYNGKYNNRTTGVETSYIPSGWVLGIPDSGGFRTPGRIMHPKAGWIAQSRWINYWMDEKTGLEEWEYHTSFVTGHAKINTLVAWKVC